MWNGFANPVPTEGVKIDDSFKKLPAGRAGREKREDKKVSCDQIYAKRRLNKKPQQQKITAALK